MNAEQLIYSVLDDFDCGVDPKELIIRLKTWADTECQGCGTRRFEHKKRHEFIGPDVTMPWG